MKAAVQLVKPAFLFWKVCPGFHHLRLVKYWKYFHSSETELKEAVTESLLCIFSAVVMKPSQGTEKPFRIKVMNHNVQVQQ